MTKTNIYANSVDPDEMAHNMSHLIWIFTVCYSILDFWLIFLFVTMASIAET